jgi:hypothetical protein
MLVVNNFQVSNLPRSDTTWRVDIVFLGWVPPQYLINGEGRFLLCFTLHLIGLCMSGTA